MKNNVILVQDVEINVLVGDKEDYICISDIAIAKDGNSRVADVIKNWLRNRYTLEFLGTWEYLYNSNFKVVEFDHFRKEAGLHSFVLSVSEWVEKTKAIGIYVKRGKMGGTYAHKDIAFEFASAISPVFKLYLIKEFQRLKELENKNIEWTAKRILTKNNYLIHTDAIKNYILPNTNYYKDRNWLKYAEEADILNVIIFKTTAKEWRDLNPSLAKDSNMRDYATINELTVLSNLESFMCIKKTILVQYNFGGFDMNNKENEVNVLDELNKGACMGKDAIHFILDKVEDEALKDELNKQYAKYQEISEKIKKVYPDYTKDKEEEPHKPNAMNKAMTWYNIEMKTFLNDGTSKIAELLLQGTNMGIIEGRRLLNNKEVSSEIHALLQEYVDMQEDAVEKLKQFL